MADSWSIIQPLRPRDCRWLESPFTPVEQTVRRQFGAMSDYPCERWLDWESRVLVLSAVEVALDKDGTSNGPEYHLSVSLMSFREGRYAPARVDTNLAKWVLAQFGVDGAEEDNHVPGGVVRNFWRPVAEPLVGKECPCKAEEVVIREMKGDFIWRP